MKFKLVESLNESMKKVNNSYLTYSTFDVKAFLLQHNEYYRVCYLRDEGLWIISKDSIHYQMLLAAEEAGYIDNADDAIAIVEHYYYLPWPKEYRDDPIWDAEWYVSTNFSEIEFAAVYDTFIIGTSIETPIEQFQTFINIFGEPTKIIKSQYAIEDEEGI